MERSSLRLSAVRASGRAPGRVRRASGTAMTSSLRSAAAKGYAVVIPRGIKSRHRASMDSAPSNGAYDVACHCVCNDSYPFERGFPRGWPCYCRLCPSIHRRRQQSARLLMTDSRTERSSASNRTAINHVSFARQV